MALNRLEELLKKKGIGPEGSKSLKEAELNEVEILFKDNAYSLTTRATLLTALLMLPASSEETIWLSGLQSEFQNILPEALFFMIMHETASTNLEKYLCTTLEGKDLNYKEACHAMTIILTDDTVPEFQKGAFLEAQRLKRESFDENKGFFDTLWNHTNRLQTELPVLIDICDNYDGFNRYHNLAPFFAAAIASCGYPCIIHGIGNVAPKFGVTSKNILEAAQGNSSKIHTEVLTNLLDTSIGWGYIDQSIFHPSLFKLQHVRKEMVKRPFLATFEKMMQPIRAAQGNHILTGFTHAHYRKEVAEQLKSQNKSAAGIVVKGLEGSSCPPLNRETIQVLVHQNEIVDQTIKPESFLQTEHNQLPLKKVTAEESYQSGKDALQGVQNEAYYQIVYYVSMALSGFNFTDREKSIALIEANLLNGKAYQHFLKGLN